MRLVLEGVLADLLQITEFDLGFYVVGAPEMAGLNETFLRHQGSTDVITFDYGEPPPRSCSNASGSAQAVALTPPQRLAGEIFVCLDEAVVQARRYHTTWQGELVRYCIHGLLHLCGYDDRTAPERRRMKRREDRLVRQLAPRLGFSRSAPRPRRRAGLAGSLGAREQPAGPERVRGQSS